MSHNIKQMHVMMLGTAMPASAGAGLSLGDEGKL
jgi:hypothetical protein